MQSLALFGRNGAVHSSVTVSVEEEITLPIRSKEWCWLNWDRKWRGKKADARECYNHSFPFTSICWSCWVKKGQQYSVFRTKFEVKCKKRNARTVTKVLVDLRRVKNLTAKNLRQNLPKAWKLDTRDNKQESIILKRKVSTNEHTVTSVILRSCSSTIRNNKAGLIMLQSTYYCRNRNQITSIRQGFSSLDTLIVKKK